MLETVAEISFALVGLAIAGRYVLKPTNKEIRFMSQNLDNAISDLTSAVSNTLVDVAKELSAISAGTDDHDAADAIEAQAQRLRAFDAALPVVAAPTPPEPAPTPAPDVPPVADTPPPAADTISGSSGDGTVADQTPPPADTMAGSAGDDSVSGATGADTVTADAGADSAPA